MIRFLLPPDLPSLGIRYSAVHLNRLEKAGQFPRRIRIGGNRVGWIAEEVEAWMEEKIKARNQELPAGAELATGELDDRNERRRPAGNSQ